MWVHGPAGQSLSPQISAPRRSGIALKRNAGLGSSSIALTGILAAGLSLSSVYSLQIPATNFLCPPGPGISPGPRGVAQPDPQRVSGVFPARGGHGSFLSVAEGTGVLAFRSQGVLAESN